MIKSDWEKLSFFIKNQSQIAFLVAWQYAIHLTLVENKIKDCWYFNKASITLLAIAKRYQVIKWCEILSIAK